MSFIYIVLVVEVSETDHIDYRLIVQKPEWYSWSLNWVRLEIACGGYELVSKKKKFELQRESMKVNFIYVEGAPDPYG